MEGAAPRGLISTLNFYTGNAASFRPECGNSITFCEGLDPCNGMIISRADVGLPLYLCSRSGPKQIVQVDTPPPASLPTEIFNLNIVPRGHCPWPCKALSGLPPPFPACPQIFSTLSNLDITSEMKCCTADVRGARLVLHLKVQLVLGQH